jgi:hypothetical protein
MVTNTSLQRKIWLLAFVALQLVGLWQSFGDWLMHGVWSHAG